MIFQSQPHKKPQPQDSPDIALMGLGCPVQLGLCLLLCDPATGSFHGSVTSEALALSEIGRHMLGIMRELAVHGSMDRLIQFIDCGLLRHQLDGAGLPHRLLIFDACVDG